MREHQIVITLKPEQFLEVQRMARAANAKSMGIFVRQQLLAALGIEGQAQSAGAGEGKVDLTPLSGELKRLHSELKTFVAESLAPYSLEAGDQGDDFEFKIEPTQPDADDYLEEAAEKTFAISPRLGAIGEDITGRDTAGRDAYALPPGAVPYQGSPTAETAAGMVNVPSANDLSAHDQYAASAVVSNVVPSVEQVTIYEQDEQTAPVAQANAALQLNGKHEPHTRREIHRYHKNAAQDVMDVPFNGDVDDRSSQPVRERYEEVVVSGSNREMRLRREQVEEPSEADSEWQTKAVDAFNNQTSTPAQSAPAVSSQFDDPLEKLLGGADVTAFTRRPPVETYDDEDEDEDDLFDVPLSIAERNRQLAGLKPAPPAVFDEDASEPSKNSVSEMNESTVASASSDQAVAENTVVENSAVNEAPVPPKTPKPAPGRPLGYPPISGNPPPKRRQV